MGLNQKQKETLKKCDASGHIYLEDYEICPGLHFCRDWDGLAVCADSPEADGCNCGRLKNFTPAQEKEDV